MWLAAGAGLLAAALAARGMATRLLVGLAVVAIAGGWFQARINERGRESLAWLAEAAGQDLAEAPVVCVRGMVTQRVREVGGWREGGRPGEARPRSAATEVRVRAVRAGDTWRSASGVLRVRIDGPARDVPRFVDAGTVVELTGRLSPARRAMNPGEAARELLAAQSGLVGTLVVTSPALAAAAEHDGLPDRARGAALGAVDSLRERVRAILGAGDDEATGQQRGRALVAAMLLGERDPGGALEEVESSFRRVGLVHLVAISGFNMAVLAWLAVLLVRLTGDRGGLEPVVCAVVLGAYLIILPGEASIRRAAFGLLAFMAAEAMGRRYDRVTLLGWIAVTLIAVRPMDLWSLGFQLSFGVVAGLMVLSGRVHARLWGVTIRGLVLTPAQRKPWRRAAAGAADRFKLAITATLIAWAVSMPLIAHHTGMVSVLAPVATLIVTPLAAMILWVGYAGVLLGLVVPPLASPAAWALGAAGESAVWLVGAIDEWPGACFYLPRLSAAWAAAATGISVFWLVRGGWRDWAGWAGAAVVIGWGVVSGVPGLGAGPGRGVAARVDVLAIGDGSCTLVQADGGAALIGCGTGAVWPRGEDVRRACRELGAWRVRTMVLPDARTEFVSLAPEVVELLGVEVALVSDEVADAAEVDAMSVAGRVLRELQARGVNVRVMSDGDGFALGVGVNVVMIGQESQAARVEAATRGGRRTVLVAPAMSHTELQGMDSWDRHADAVVLPRTLRSGERPGETLRAVGARAAVHAAGVRHARELAARLGEFDRRSVWLAAEAGAVGLEIGGSGDVRIIGTAPAR